MIIISVSLCSVYSKESDDSNGNIIMSNGIAVTDNVFISSEIFMLSLPALVYFLMIVAMISYVLFKWKWGIRSVSLIS